MKEILKQHASYNAWANQRLIELIITLPEEQLHRTIVSSFTSIHKTLLHLWDAESTWWQRMNLSEQIIWPGTIREYSTEEIANELFQQNRQWIEWVSEAALNHV